MLRIYCFRQYTFLYISRCFYVLYTFTYFHMFYISYLPIVSYTSIFSYFLYLSTWISILIAGSSSPSRRQMLSLLDASAWVEKPTCEMKECLIFSDATATGLILAGKGDKRIPLYHRFSEFTRCKFMGGETYVRNELLYL